MGRPSKIKVHDGGIQLELGTVTRGIFPRVVARISPRLSIADAMLVKYSSSGIKDQRTE